MSLEQALTENTAAIRELIAALAAQSVIQPVAATPPIVQAVIKAQKEIESKEGKKIEAAKPKAEKPAPVEEAPLVGEIPEKEIPAIPEIKFTFADVQQLVTKLATPGAYEDGRAKAIAVLQRHGLTKFTEEQVKGNQALIQDIGTLIAATIAGELDPRESLS